CRIKGMRGDDHANAVKLGRSEQAFKRQARSCRYPNPTPGSLRGTRAFRKFRGKLDAPRQRTNRLPNARRPQDPRMSDKPLTDIPFSNFDLHPSLLAGLEAAGFSRCTPIQAMTLPLTLEGRDVAGQAQTGTGKTLAFLVTVINRLMTRPALADRKPEDPRALILAPTRELAIQIHKDAVKFASDLGLDFALVYGGVDYDKQRSQMQAGADVIIATPGRLIDYVKQHKVVSLHA